MNLATFFTLLRVLAIPVIIIVYYSDLPWHHPLASVLFVLAALTDWLDGYLARKLDQCTPFGAFLDPVADKLLVTVILVMLAANYTSPWFVAPASIIVGREILISALREWMAENRARDQVAVAYVGKMKTTVQMAAIAALLAGDPAAFFWLPAAGYGLLYLAAVLTLWSMGVYLRNAWPVLNSGRK